jgi:hypothetical protein
MLRVTDTTKMTQKLFTMTKKKLAAQLFSAACSKPFGDHQCAAEYETMLLPAAVLLLLLLNQATL